MNRYGSDKPDIRFGLELHDFSEEVSGCGFRVFTECIAAGGKVKGLCVPGGAVRSRKEIEALESWLKQYYSVRGLAWMKWQPDGVSGGVSKLLGGELAGSAL